MASTQNKKNQILLFSSSNGMIRAQQLESLVMPCKLFMQGCYPTTQFLVDTNSSEHLIEGDNIVILSGYFILQL